MVDHVAQHWDEVYSTKAAVETSWYQPEARTSMHMLGEAVGVTGAGPGSVIDVGAGTSMLADELLAAGWSPVTVLDVSAAALERTRRRLDGRGDVRFVVSDILTWHPEGIFDAWHDRAVFHFLTEHDHQARYVATAASAVRPGGVLVIGTFGPGGPEQCSGLPVARHDVAGIRSLFAADFDLVAGEAEVHRTPWGSEQQFTWASLRRH